MDEHSWVVLHVEDDEQVSAGTRMLLQAYGYHVISTANGADALRLLATEKVIPDVLIADIMLPGEIDGIDVAEETRRIMRHVVPTVLLSGELTSAGMPWLPGTPLICLWKPADPEALVAVVDAFARLGRLLQTRAGAAERVVR